MGSRSTASAAGGTRRSRTAGPRVTGAHWLRLVGQREASRQQRMVEPPPGMMQMGRVRLQWGVAQTIVGIFKGIKKFQQNVATRTGNASEPPRPLQVSCACHRHGAQWASILLPKTATVRAAGSGPDHGTSVTRVRTNPVPAQEVCGGAGGCRHKAARTSETPACPENPRKRPSSLGVWQRSLHGKQEPPC